MGRLSNKIGMIPRAAVVVFFVVVMACTAEEIRNPQQISQLSSGPARDASSCDGDLNTYCISTVDADIKVLGSGRKGTTRIAVQLQKDAISTTMPVIKASLQGLVHNVASCWSFLKVRECVQYTCSSFA